MYTEIKQSAEYRIPVRLLSTTTFSGLTGITSPTVFIQKYEGTPSLKPITNNINWFEVDSINFPGVYDLVLSSIDTNTAGQLKVSVKDVSSDYYIGIYTVLQYTTSEVYQVIDFSRKYMRNHTKIDAIAKTFTIYDDDGITPLVVYDLRDAAGVSSSASIYERIPQTTWTPPTP